MRCLYCDNEINKFKISSLLYKDEKLCLDCRNSLRINRAYINLDDIRVETFYNYDDGIFKSLLMQYKECYDEALSTLFIERIIDYLQIKYHGYELLFIPSSKEKLNKRGFNHLDLIFKDLHLKKNYGLIMKEELVQEGKNFNERYLMADNYVYIGDKLNKVLIVDDVITSGSSILGAYRAIKSECKSVKAICLARKENAFILNKKCV